MVGPLSAIRPFERILAAVLMALAPIAWACAQVPGAETSSAGSNHADTAPIPLEHFARRDNFKRLKISPTGRYLAMLVDADTRDRVVTLRTDTLAPISTLNLADHERIRTLVWGSPERLLFSVYDTENSFDDDEEQIDGWATLRADGTDLKRIWALRPMSDPAIESYRTGNFQLVEAPGNDDGIVIVRNDVIRDGRRAMVLSRLDTNTGKFDAIARLPGLFCQVAMRGDLPSVAVCPASKRDAPDHGPGAEIFRYDGQGQWTSVHRYVEGDEDVTLAGWSSDGTPQVYHDDGHATATVGTLDPQTGAFNALYQDPQADPMILLTDNDRRSEIIGVVTAAALPKVTLTSDHDDAAVYRSLSGKFPRSFVMPFDGTRDGKQFLFGVESDTTPTDLYLFDRTTMQARHLLRQRPWLPEERMATVKPFVVTVRDGTRVYGYLTIPHGSDGKHLPMIVDVHGGPMGVRDDWMFDVESQMLASRGYLVLHVNYRGSLGYGSDFARKAYGQWGSGIMHDILDATHWAIDNGHADRERICIYGGSFGGYAAMMAPTLEPGLFRCAFGFVGLYDPELQMARSDTSHTRMGRNYLREAMGETQAERDAVSPVKRAHLIGIPTFLVAGKDDRRCPPAHTLAMRDALVAAGNPPEGVIVQKGEGHGFAKPENRLMLYTQMLAFFDRHIGPQRKQPSPAQPRPVAPVR